MTPLPRLRDGQPDILFQGDTAARRNHERLASIDFLESQMDTPAKRKACGAKWCRWARGRIRELDGETEKRGAA